MTSDDNGVRIRNGRLDPPDARQHVLRPLLQNIRLAEDDSAPGVHINCVEYWSMCIGDQYMIWADPVLL